MMIHCPTCASHYELDPDVLVEGRILRCAHCREAWGYRSAEPLRGEGGRPGFAALPPPSPTIVAPARAARRAGPAARAWAEPPPRRRLRRLSARFSSAVAATLAGALLIGGMAAVAGKESVVAAFPPSATVFATLGLPVNLRGLALADVRSTIETGEGAPMLTLQGRITNLRDRATAVPALRIAVRDKSRRELYYWTVPAPKPELAAGEAVPFRSRLSAPPHEGQELAVSFAEPALGTRRVAEAFAGDR